MEIKDKNQVSEEVTQIANNQSNAQVFGNLLASFGASFVVFLVQFGVPITPEQQSAILSVIVTGWAIISAGYAWYRASRKSS